MTPPPQDDASDGSAQRDPLRRRIAEEAARSVAAGSDATRALYRAARRVGRGWVPADRLPSHDEIRAGVRQRLDPAGALAHLAGDRFDRLAALVSVLAAVRQDPVAHPEGDVLEHSLQVFEFVHAERPYDEELLTAALVHDVGTSIDRGDPVASGVAALGDLVTPRTRWLVETLPAARAYADRSLGHRGRQRLEAHADFDDVMLLAEADRRGRVRGFATPSLEEAIAILRALEADDAEEDSSAERPEERP